MYEPFTNFLGHPSMENDSPFYVDVNTRHLDLLPENVGKFFTNNLRSNFPWKSGRRQQWNKWWNSFLMMITLHLCQQIFETAIRSKKSEFHKSLPLKSDNPWKSNSSHHVF